MRILAGKDKSDSGGKIMFLKDIRIAFLEQEYPFDGEKSIFQQIMSSSEEFTKGLDQEHLWEYERRVLKFLTNFNLPNPDQKMKELSGGEVKRVALTQMLASEAEFFIMDEPTNHLDIDAIEFLEGYLSRSRCTLLMVTHDRYWKWTMEQSTHTAATTRISLKSARKESPTIMQRQTRYAISCDANSNGYEVLHVHAPERHAIA